VPTGMYTGPLFLVDQDKTPGVIRTYETSILGLTRGDVAVRGGLTLQQLRTGMAMRDACQQAMRAK
jgi:hypothetical protein